MIKKRLYLIIILFNLTLGISYAQDFKVSYYYDKSNSLKLKDIKNKLFLNIPKQYSLSIEKNIVWYKVDINNNSSLNKKLFLHNNFGYMSKEIELYESFNNKIINKEIYNLFDKNIGKKLRGKTIVYPINLNANSIKTIYIKNTSLVHQILGIEIYDEKQSIQNSISQSFYGNIIVTILFTLALYNLMLYIFIKRKEFAFYSLYLLNCGIGLFYMYGSVFQNLNLYGEEIYLFNITAIFVTLFLALFIKYLFDIDKQNKKLNIALNSFIVLVSIDILLALFVDLYMAMKLLEFIYMASFIVIFYIGFNLYKQKHPLAKLFLIAYIIYIIGFGITVMSLVGIIRFTTLNFHASGISLVLEGFIFSYMLSYRLKLLEQKVLQQKNELLIKNKKEQFGEIIGNIAHQWRQPLNRINLNLAVIDEALEDEIIDKDLITKKINSTEKNIHYMSDTVEDFMGFYNPNKEKELFVVYDVVQKAFNLLSLRIKDIDIKISFDKTIKIDGITNEFLQVLLIILNNAIDNFEIKKIKNKKISIELKVDKQNTNFTISDNGGGISKENIDKIFDPYFTTKFKSEGAGLGLYVARMIIEEGMDGKLQVQTNNNITIFKIKLNKNKGN